MAHSAGVSQDPPQRAGERGELVRMSSKETSGSPEASELGSPRSVQNFDLLSMVVSYKRMAMFLEPVTDSVELIRYLLGWRMPLCSLLVYILLNIFFFTVSEVGWLLVCVLGVSAPAALGYLQDMCGGETSEAELQRRRYNAVHRRDLLQVNLTKQDAMLQVKDLLKHLDDMLSTACVSAESVYKVLYWDNHSKSSRFYGGLLLVMCLLYTTPVAWMLAVLNSALFLWNKDFCRVLLNLLELFNPGRAQASDTETGHAEQDSNLQDWPPTPTSLVVRWTASVDLSPGSVEEAEEAEPDDEFKDAIEEHSISQQASPLVLVEDDDVHLGPPDYDNISDCGLLSRKEPIRSKVSMLTEKLRKRYPTTATGNCSSCNAVFSVLKKRRSCSNCGNSFCSRCCSFKVLRSCMGATAPEAQRETVFVCATCNSSLNKML